MTHQEQFEALQETMSKSIFKAIELEAGFAVINAGVMGSMDQTEVNPHRFELNQLVTVAEVFADRADELNTLLSSAESGYKKLFQDMQSKLEAGTTQEVAQ